MIFPLDNSVAIAKIAVVLKKTSEHRRRHPVKKWMDDTGTKAVDLAWRLRISEAHLSLILSWDRAITMPVALRLSLETGLPVEKLLNDREHLEILKEYVNQAKASIEIPKKSGNAA